MTGAAMTTTPATSMPASLRSFTDAAADAVAREIASLRKEAQHARELHDAEYRARLAELDARLASVAELERRVETRLASLKDGEPGPRGFGLDDFDTELVEDGRVLLLKFTRGDVTEIHEIPLPAGRDADPAAIGPLVEDAVARIPKPKDVDMEAVAARIDQQMERLVPLHLDKAMADVGGHITSEVDRVLSGWEKPKDGESVEIADLEPLILEAVEAAVARIPKPKDGESVEIADLEPTILEAVEAAVARIPKPKDVDMDAVKASITSEVDRVLSGWEKPKDGESVEIADLEPTILEAVEAAVARIPRPKDVDMDVVRETIASEVDRVLASWEKPKDGESVEIADLEPTILEAVEAAVARIPKPKDGAPGLLPPVKAWTDEVHYAGNVCAHGGSTWQAVKDTAKEPPHDDWICIARGGADGRSPRVRETFDADADYSRLDIVALNGAAFIARRDDPGVCPGEGWQIISMQGKQGKPGQSIKGDPGPPGPALRMLSTEGECTLVARNADGTEVHCDLYPILSRLG
ncbi:MAG: hypothetical protein M9944_08015 [Rhizobiaceae bacterium]|nr:hypothetical protein [Rhizobiaceae bacterium]